MSFENRSDALIEVLTNLDSRSLDYVLVGGYAVSAFNTRFSTDLDIVVASEDRDEFRSFLDDNGFEEIDRHEKSWFYDTEVLEFEKRLAPNQPIGFDLLVNGLGCRQTSAQWSFDYLHEHSTERQISGGTSSTTARTVEGAVLVAAKLHSGRETDLRDVVAIAPDIDLAAVTPHLHRGEDQKLRTQLERGIEILDGEEIRHGFKSEFGASAVSAETIESVRAYLEEQIRRLSRTDPE